MATKPATNAPNHAPMSMVNPSTDALMKKIDSRYSLVVLAAKRARQILVGSPIRSSHEHSVKDVTNALEEILEGKINYVTTVDETEEINEEPVAVKSETANDAETETASAPEPTSDETEDADGLDDVSDFVVDASVTRNASGNR